MLNEAALQTTQSASDITPQLRFRRLKRALRKPLMIAGAAIVLVFVVTALIGPYVTPKNPDAIYYSAVLHAPDRTFLFGTDDVGRDIFSRVVAGARISLEVGLVAVGIAMVGGTLLGLVSGYFGGWTDSVIMRVIDVMLAFPDIILALVIIAILGPSLINVMVAVGIGSIPVYTRTVRASVLTVREKPYVEAARALGVSSPRIMLGHILPNVAAPIIVLATLGVGLAILTAAGLSFIGLGAQPPTPEWGDMLNDARAYLHQAPWMGIFPGVAIMLTVVGLNLLGDSLRDILDPTLR
ncbi:MAG: ABC transporter permease [Chloroflexota bacterium]